MIKDDRGPRPEKKGQITGKRSFDLDDKEIVDEIMSKSDDDRDILHERKETDLWLEELPDKKYHED